MKHVDELEIDQDLEFQKCEWVVERVSWFVGLAIIVLGLLGLFGTGLISSATAGDANGPISVDYQRFVRHGGEMSLTMTAAPDQVQDGQVELWISATILDKVDLQQFSHEPDEVRNEGDRTVFVFLTGDAPGPLTITVNMRSHVFGRIAGEIGIVDGSYVRVSQFSYP